MIYKLLQCVPVKGRGFVSGAYVCYCNEGFYFPSNNKTTEAYIGDDLEDYFREHGVIKPGLFRCVACAPGCETCVDDSPCLHEYNIFLKITLLTLTLLTVMGIICVALVIYIYRNNKVCTETKMFIYYFHKKILQCIIIYDSKIMHSFHCQDWAVSATSFKLLLSLTRTTNK